MEHIAKYLDEVSQLIANLPQADIQAVIKVLLEAYRQGRTVFIMGNGGSASTASHFACDLGKGTSQPGRPRFRVISLADNIPLMTAWANDSAYRDIFAEQLINLVRSGDVVIGISGSGNSRNITKALKRAREAGAITVGFCGFDGGRLKDLVDYCIHVKSSCIQQVEDAHLVLQHLICVTLQEELSRL